MGLSTWEIDLAAGAATRAAYRLVQSVCPSGTRRDQGVEQGVIGRGGIGCY